MTARRRNSRSRKAPPPDESAEQHGDVVRIRKYPNRQLYDTSQSCLINQEQLYDLVAGGHAVQVTDARTEEDITNQTLATALIEHDPDKLRHFPAWILHYMIRTNEQSLVQFFSRYWTQLFQAFMLSQPSAGTRKGLSRSKADKTAAPFPFTAFPGAAGATTSDAMNPWAWFESIMPGQPDSQPTQEERPSETTTASDKPKRGSKKKKKTKAKSKPGAGDRSSRGGRQRNTQEIADLQRQVAALAQRLAELNAES